MEKQGHGLVYRYSDKWIGGRQLQLFPDHTFKFNDYNYANCSDCEQLCWGQDLNIFGSWTYDKKNYILTLAAQKWNGTSQKYPIQPSYLDSVFKQRVVQTNNFYFDNDEVNCFEADWNYDRFEGIRVKVLKSKLKNNNSKPYIPPVNQQKKQLLHVEPKPHKQQKKHENKNHQKKGCQNRNKHEDLNPNNHHKNK